MLTWCRANGCECDEETCASAAEGGHLEVLQWCRRHDCPWDDRTCSAAAGGGHLEVGGKGIRWRRGRGGAFSFNACHVVRPLTQVLGRTVRGGEVLLSMIGSTIKTSIVASE